MNLSRAPRLTRLYLRLEPDAVRRVEQVAAILIAGALFLTLAAHSLAGIPSPIRRQFTLAGENNLAVWFASMLLFYAGLIGLVCAGVERQAAATGLHFRRDSGLTGLAWTTIALGFFFLSLNELGSLRKHLGDPAVVSLLLTEGAFPKGRAALFAAPLLLLAGSAVWTGWKSFRTVPCVMPLMVIGVLLFLSASVRDYFEAASGAAIRHADIWGWPAWEVVMNEGTELLATFCWLAAGLRFAEHRSRGIRRLDGKVGLDVGWRLPLAVIAVLGVTIAAVYLAASDLPRATDGRGIPSNWFPATAAFLGSLLALHLAVAETNRIGSPPGSRLALRSLVVVNLALSANYAANFPVYHLLDHRPALQSGWVFAVGTGVLLTGMFAARISNSGIVAAGLLAWSLGFLLRPFFAAGSWAALFLFTQIALLVALQAMLAERVRQKWVVQQGGTPDEDAAVRLRRDTA